jgi:hypothetical protein
LLAKPLRRGRQQLVFLRHAEPARQKLHFLPVADFLTRHPIDRRSHAIENDHRALSVLQNRSLSCSPASKSKSSRASRRQLT